MAREAAKIIWPRSNEAAAFTKLFTSEKNPELRTPSGISREIKRMLKIKCGKSNRGPRGI